MDKLSSKCLIMADNTLEKGLSVVKQRKEEEPQLGSGRPSTQEGGGHHVKLEDGKVDAEGEETVGVEGLSCAAMTWKNSLSNTIDRTDHWKGEPVCWDFRWLESLWLSVRWFCPPDENLVFRLPSKTLW